MEPTGAQTADTTVTRVLVVTMAADRRVSLQPGEQLVFGRGPGPGQIAPRDTAVSARHGVIEALDGRWAVHSTGRVASFNIYDCQTPSTLHVPLGAGPVPVPFNESVIAIEVEDHSRCC